MLEINTDGARVTFQNRLEEPSGFPRNILWYRPTEERLEFIFIGQIRPFTSEEWGQVNFNGTVVTKDNVDELFKDFFF